MSPLRVALYASGRGSNFEAILQAHSRGELQGPQISLLPALLIVNKASARAIDSAKHHGIPFAVIPDPAPDQALIAHHQLHCLQGHHIDRIALAGYLRKVPDRVVQAYRGKILNIHPGPLPRFGGAGMYGLRVHQAVLDAEVSHSGPTVHRVDEVYDRGPIIAHEPVEVEPGDDAPSLAARVLRVEHRLYAQAMMWEWAKDPKALAPHQRAGISAS